MTLPFTQPKLNLTAFNCPHCRAYSKMNWSRVVNDNNTYVDGLKITYCTHCYNVLVWFEDKIIYPNDLLVDTPNTDLPEDIQKDYYEAANILNASPRGAAALLRLVIDKIADHLESEGKTLNDKIGYLVKNNNLNPKIQKALDTVRVVGNNAVHPGTIELTDSRETAEKLFKLINLIAQELISNPKEVDALYEELVPEKQKNSITKRDSK